MRRITLNAQVNAQQKINLRQSKESELQTNNQKSQQDYL